MTTKDTQTPENLPAIEAEKDIVAPLETKLEPAQENVAEAQAEDDLSSSVKPKEKDKRPPTKEKKNKKKRRRKEEPAKSGPGCFSRLIGILGILVTIGLIVAFVAALKYSTSFLALTETPAEVVVKIPEGASVAQIGQALEEGQAIRSGQAFVWTVRAMNLLNTKVLERPPINLKAGEMALDPSLPVWDVIKQVAKGNYKLYPFTVPEGKNMFEVAKMVEDAGLGSAADFLALCQDRNYIYSLGLNSESLEGYLFPETYNFPKGTDLKTIIKTMTDSFFKVWKKYEALVKEKGMTRQQVVTLASIVEKETGAARERPIIAGVFLNRLAKGMRLQTDPTVIYGIKDFDGNITRAHLRANHPYNTYVIPGLPPGPISNPGEAAISAVVKPAIVPYLYFVSKNDGTHHFSETLAEHNSMVRKYQRGGR